MYCRRDCSHGVSKEESDDVFSVVGKKMPDQ
jgi:hypothetical protein